MLDASAPDADGCSPPEPWSAAFAGAAASGPEGVEGRTVGGGGVVDRFDAASGTGDGDPAFGVGGAGVATTGAESAAGGAVPLPDPPVAGGLVAGVPVAGGPVAGVPVAGVPVARVAMSATVASGAPAGES
ncbi:MAG TPA: hypothetical protein VN799_00635 [Acidimicrobiales bacterium]|nr:hypothetical protein [Acidimicrobiales bacterium]